MTNQNKSYAHFNDIVNLLRNAYIPKQLFTKFRGGPLRGPVVWGPLVSCLKVHTVRYASACAPELAPVLNKLFKFSYNLSIFPSSWKLAHIFPIPKKVTNLTLQTIALLQSLLSSLRLWRPLSPNNCSPSLKQTALFLIINMGFDKPDLPVIF